jgi:hypothetical protein
MKSPVQLLYPNKNILKTNENSGSQAMNKKVINISA